MGNYYRTGETAKENYEAWIKENPNVQIIDIDYRNSFWTGEQIIVKYKES